MKNLTYLFIIMILSGFIGYSANYYYQRNYLRSPASIKSSEINHKVFLSGKTNYHMIVHIASPQLPKTNDDITEITGYVQSPRDAIANIHWELPNDIQIEEGTVDYQDVNLVANEPFELKLKVKNFSKEDRKLISLQAQSAVGTQAIGNSFTISSRPEESWEYYAPVMQKAAAELKLTQGEVLNQKIIK